MASASAAFTCATPPGLRGRAARTRRAGRADSATMWPAPARRLLLIHSINAAGSAYEVRPIFEHPAGAAARLCRGPAGFGFSDRSPRAYTIRPVRRCGARHAGCDRGRRRRRTHRCAGDLPVERVPGAGGDRTTRPHPHHGAGHPDRLLPHLSSARMRANRARAKSPGSIVYSPFPCGPGLLQPAREPA